MTSPARASWFVFLRSGAATVLVLVAAACTVGQPGQETTPSAGRSFTAPLPEGLETVPPSEPPVLGEVPEAILLRIREDLAARLQTDVTGAIVIVAQEVVWNDGSLGCPERGVFYTQALVPGYQVVLELDGERYDYRADQRGIVRLCEPRAPVTQP